jgi:threonine dehydrogenase-like Zn-dependent dehydrogenase
MKALVFHDVGDIRLDDVEAPKIQEPTDAIIRLTSSAICGTDLHIWVSIEAHALFAGQKRLSTPANRGPGLLFCTTEDAG